MPADALLPAGSARDGDDRLTIGGCRVADLVARAGTPAYLVAEDALRDAARDYVRALGADVLVCFASKPFPCSAIIRVFASEGLGCDVASAGELAIALAGGMPPERIVVHGNAKTDDDLRAALEARAGLIVVDSIDELDRLEALATNRQELLLRVNPAVAAPTHEAMATGHASSKFGLPPEQLRAAASRIEIHEHLVLAGVHAHIGSQITDLEPFAACVEALGRVGRFGVYDLGGGLGVRYTPDEPEAPSVGQYADRVLAAVERHLPRESRLLVEPGRSLVARAGVTAYRVVSVKRAGRTFVAVDGGMGDNLEPMLYGQRFAPFVLDADRPLERCDVVGRHCETGDRLAADVELAAPRVGDVVVVPVTGAYCFTMANNYNGAARPPVVLCADGRARVVVRRETIGDLLARDVDLDLDLRAVAGGAGPPEAGG